MTRVGIAKLMTMALEGSSGPATKLMLSTWAMRSVIEVSTMVMILTWYFVLTECVVVDAHARAVADIVHLQVQIDECLVLNKGVIYTGMADEVD